VLFSLDDVQTPRKKERVRERAHYAILPSWLEKKVGFETSLLQDIKQNRRTSTRDTARLHLLSWISTPTELDHYGSEERGTWQWFAQTNRSDVSKASFLPLQTRSW